MRYYYSSKADISRARSALGRVSVDILDVYIMNDFHRMFEIDSQHHILICRCCQYAVIPSHVKTHLNTHHKRLSIQQRADLVSRVERSTELAKIHTDVTYPSPTEPPITSLPLFFDGLRCKGTDARGKRCTYVSRTLYRMQEHCKKNHQWVNQQKRGGDSRKKQIHTQNKIWTENHACQRFFKVSTWQRYFEVARQDVRGSEQQQTDQKNDFFRLQEDDVRQAEHDASEDANRVHGFDDHVSAVVPWLRETGIADHIQSLRKDEIRTAIAVPPPGDESDLRTIVDAMESLLRDAHRLCFDGPECMLTYQCRVVLSRFQPSQNDLTGKTRPFDPYKGPKSLASYFATALPDRVVLQQSRRS
jgi:hypothetical protein